jgi:GMP synthase (glutamine-hydrolysing)
MVGNFALALQFHPEVTEQGLDRWYVGHTCELRAKHIDIKLLRNQGRTHAPALEKAAAEFWRLWLDHIL